MTTLWLITFLAITVVDCGAFVAVMRHARPANWLVSSYWLSLIVVVAVTGVMTGYFSYFADANTHIMGWPIPRVIFQRDSPEGPWQDYVALTLILAYPMNFLIYMLIPSVVALAASWRERCKIRARPKQSVRMI